MPLSFGIDDAALVPPLQLAGRDPSEGDDLLR